MMCYVFFGIALVRHAYDNGSMLIRKGRRFLSHEMLVIEYILWLHKVLDGHKKPYCESENFNQSIDRSLLI